jgi:hypothetical protein
MRTHPTGGRMTSVHVISFPPVLIEHEPQTRAYINNAIQILKRLDADVPEVEFLDFVFLAAMNTTNFFMNEGQDKETAARTTLLLLHRGVSSRSEEGGQEWTEERLLVQLFKNQYSFRFQFPFTLTG